MKNIQKSVQNKLKFSNLKKWGQNPVAVHATVVDLEFVDSVANCFLLAATTSSFQCFIAYKI